MKRIAVFSDVHANLEALTAVRQSIAAQSLDAVYCLGDLGGYGAQPNEVQQVVMEMQCPTVLGNYDEGVGFDKRDCGCQYTDPFEIQMSDISFSWTREHTTKENKRWLRKLPREIRLEMDGRRILLCHGSPRSTVEYLFQNRSDGYLRQFTAEGKASAGADAIFFGHTHVPFHRTVDNVHFINTGSVGRPKDGDPRAGYCIATLDDDRVQVEQVRVPYDVEAACQKIISAGLPEYFAAYLRTGANFAHPANL